VLACRVSEPDEWCRRCGCEGVPRDSLIRRLAHEAFGWRPTTLEITTPRYAASAVGMSGDKTPAWRLSAGEAISAGTGLGTRAHTRMTRKDSAGMAFGCRHPGQHV
jgi:hypothetical protein